MQMVGHQAIGRAKEALPCRCVEQDFAKGRVECRRQPAAGAFFDRERPEYDGMP
jgi:hypothetical protein